MAGDSVVVHLLLSKDDSFLASYSVAERPAASSDCDSELMAENYRDQIVAVAFGNSREALERLRSEDTSKPVLAYPSSSFPKESCSKAAFDKHRCD